MRFHRSVGKKLRTFFTELARVANVDTRLIEVRVMKRAGSADYAGSAVNRVIRLPLPAVLGYDWVQYGRSFLHELSHARGQVTGVEYEQDVEVCERRARRAERAVEPEAIRTIAISLNLFRARDTM